MAGRVEEEEICEVKCFSSIPIDANTHTHSHTVEVSVISVWGRSLVSAAGSHTES